MKYCKIIAIAFILIFNFSSTIAANYEDLVEFNELKHQAINQNISGLNISTSSGEEIISHLSHDVGFEKLFRASAGVHEGYSIKEHTLMVFEVFTKQFQIYNAHYNFQVLPNVRLLETLKLAIALHDIGKPYAIAAGDKDQQHEFTIPLLEKAFVYLGFSANETKLAKALVDNDTLGDFVKAMSYLERESKNDLDKTNSEYFETAKKSCIEKAKNELKEMAQIAGMSVNNYASLQFLFYTADAASYPGLRKRVFTTINGGMIVPNDSLFQKLWDSL